MGPFLKVVPLAADNSETSSGSDSQNPVFFYLGVCLASLSLSLSLSRSLSH